MQCALLYHDGTLDVDLGERRGVRVAGNVYPAPLSDPERSLAEALERPIGAPALRKIIPQSGSISVLISDLTRGGGTGWMLAALLGFLEAHGAGPDRVTVIAALGMHRGFRQGELEAHVGADIVRRWKVLEDDLVERFGICPWKPGYEEYLLEGIADEDILVIADASRFLPVKR